MGLRNWGEIQDIQIAKGASHLIHFMFADDTMLFCKTDANEIMKSNYGTISGQKVNYDESYIRIRRPSISSNIKRTIIACMKMALMPEGIKYLGMPLFGGRNKTTGYLPCLHS